MQVMDDASEENVTRRLTIEDIPSDFLYESDRVPLTSSYHRFATEVAKELGVSGTPTGHHLTQAQWQLKYALVAKGLRDVASPLPNPIGEDAQFISLAAFQLAVVSCTAALDLAAAFLVGLAGGDLTQRVPDLRDVAEKRRKIPTLPTEHADWVEETHEQSRLLFEVRDAMVHRHVPVNVTIGAAHRYEVRGINTHSSISEFIDMVADRLVRLLLLVRPAA